MPPQAVDQGHLPQGVAPLATALHQRVHRGATTYATSAIRRCSRSGSNVLRIPLHPRSRRPQTAPVLQPAPRAQTGAGIGNNSERLPGGSRQGGWTGPCHKPSRPRHTFRLWQVVEGSCCRLDGSGSCSTLGTQTSLGRPRCPPRHERLSGGQRASTAALRQAGVGGVAPERDHRPAPPGALASTARAAFHGTRPSVDGRDWPAPDGHGLLNRHGAASPTPVALVAERLRRVDPRPLPSGIAGSLRAVIVPMAVGTGVVVIVVAIVVLLIVLIVAVSMRDRQKRSVERRAEDHDHHSVDGPPD